jgi:hypothetical protein
MIFTVYPEGNMTVHIARSAYMRQNHITLLCKGIGGHRHLS